MWLLVLAIAAALFVGYAVYTKYNLTPTDKSVPKRVWASVLMAGAAIGAAIMALFHSGPVVP